MKNMLKPEKLKQLIEEATLDCYDEYEQRVGFYTVLEENIQFPFKATVVGEEVEVVRVEQENDRVDAICKRKGKSYTVDILNIEYKPQDVDGWEWIEVYRAWAEGS